jgi:peroxiredoxin
MLHFLLSTSLALFVSADVPLEAGTQLNFRGGVEARGAEPGSGHKTFDLTLWITKKSDEGAEIFWLVDERGRGEFPWPARFGRLGVDKLWRTAAAGPALLYDRGDGRSAVPIPLPFLATEQPLAAGGTLREGKLELHVNKSTKVADRPVWQIGGRDPFGPKRVLWADQRGPLVLAMTEKVIMGRGDEYQLKLEWIGAEQIAGEHRTALEKVIDRLTALGGKLNLPAGVQEIDWKSEQLAVLREQLPTLAELAVATPLAKLVAAAQRDFEVQAGRSDSVAALSSKFSGRFVEDFSAKGFDADELSLAALKGQVTVLHFWEYRDEPLKEPYGQVGYLDFMYHRRKANGLQVFGVAVDGRLAEEKTRAAAERSVKKLKAFMNLSYPLILDSGGLVKQFGDPRVIGASLPLFVVIGPDQKIIHYHVGHYEVHQDQGLKELDEAVLKALDKK